MPDPNTTTAVVLSFDVEEHYRIEAAVGLKSVDHLKAVYVQRMETTTRQLLEQLSGADVKATFYIVGQIAESHPKLVRDISDAGHEVGTHGWDHQRVHRFTPESFRNDIRQSKEALEQATGQPVYGYRAPTFSVMRQTAWAVDVLAESGLLYDSSIFPVRHDRYGVPDAPRVPFMVQGEEREILELPPTTFRVLGMNHAVAGGGYFRLYPLQFMKAGIRQLTRDDSPLAMLYFHPWEFDPDQPRLPLKPFAKWRTYVGISKSTDRLGRLLKRYQTRFRRAIDVVNQLESQLDELPRFALTAKVPVS